MKQISIIIYISYPRSLFDFLILSFLSLIDSGCFLPPAPPRFAKKNRGPNVEAAVTRVTRSISSHLGFQLYGHTPENVGWIDIKKKRP